MLTERSIVNFLIWTAGLIVSPWLAVEAACQNFTPLLVLIAVTIVACIFGIWRDRISFAPFLATFCVGKLNFLPLSLGPQELSAFAVVFYYLIAYAALRRQMLRTGPLIFFIPIVALTLIVLSDEPNFGVHALGGNREGGRGVILIILGTATYLCGVSMKSPPPGFVTLVPIYSLAAMIIFSLPYVITTYVPAAAPYLYLFSDDINVSAYGADVMNSGEIVRNSNQALIGSSIVGCIVSYFPITTWWRPQRWWCAVIMFGCTTLVLMGGYRSELIDFMVLIGVATFCYVGWRALAVLPFGLAALLAILLAHNSHLITLPVSAQRTLTMFPGDWDPAAVGNTEASNTFRQDIIDMYLKDYAHLHPFFGNGLSFDTEEYESTVAMGKLGYDPYWQSKIFISGKMFHTGWLSVYDAVGIVGFAFFVFISGAIMYVTGRSVFQKPVRKNSSFFPLKVWLFSSVTMNVFGFFTVFGDFKGTLPAYCFYAIAWYHMDRLEREGYNTEPRPRTVSFEAKRVGMLAT